MEYLWESVDLVRAFCYSRQESTCAGGCNISGSRQAGVPIPNRLQGDGKHSEEINIGMPSLKI